MNTVEKPFVLAVDARKLLFLTLLKTSVDILIAQKGFVFELSYALEKLNLTCSFILITQEVKRIDK